MLLLNVGQDLLPAVARIPSDRLCTVNYWRVVVFWTTIAGGEGG